MRKQLSLFPREIKRIKKMTYSDLSVNQKINYKANLCTKPWVYKSFYNYFKQPLFQPSNINGLTDDYHWHSKQNGGSENRLNAFRFQGELFI